MEKHKLSPNLVALYLSTFKKNTYKQMFHNDGSCSIFYQRALSYVIDTISDFREL